MRHQKNCDFEEAGGISGSDAAVYRRLAQKSEDYRKSTGEDKDVIAMAMDEEDAVVQVFFIREGKMIGRDHFYLRIAADATPCADPSEFCETVLCRDTVYPERADAAKRY